MKSNGPLTRYVTLQVAHALGMPGTFFLPPQISDPDMHHSTCITQVPWCMPESLTSDFLCSQWRAKTFPAFLAHAQPAILRIWQEAHGTSSVNNSCSWLYNILPQPLLTFSSLLESLDKILTINIHYHIQYFFHQPVPIFNLFTFGQFRCPILPQQLTPVSHRSHVRLPSSCFLCLTLPFIHVPSWSPTFNKQFLCPNSQY